jgi:hypothetical protein
MSFGKSSNLKWRERNRKEMLRKFCNGLEDAFCESLENFIGTNDSARNVDKFAIEMAISEAVCKQFPHLVARNIDVTHLLRDIVLPILRASRRTCSYIQWVDRVFGGDVYYYCLPSMIKLYVDTYCPLGWDGEKYFNKFPAGGD